MIRHTHIHTQVTSSEDQYIKPCSLRDRKAAASNIQNPLNKECKLCAKVLSKRSPSSSGLRGWAAVSKPLFWRGHKTNAWGGLRPAFHSNWLGEKTVRLTDKSMFISGIKPVTDGLGEIIIQQFIEPRLNAKIWVCFATLELNTHSDRTVLPLPTFTAIMFASLGAWCTLRKAIPNSSSFARTLWHCWHCCSSKAITAL